MPDQPALQIQGDDSSVHATWGRSGRRLILTISDGHSGDPRQVLLTAAQAADLGRFLCEGPRD